MDKNTVDKLRNLIDATIYAATKNDAKIPIRQLEFMASNIKGKIHPYAFGKLREAINYAMEASGRVENKEHWISNVNTSWYVFENDVVDEE